MPVISTSIGSDTADGLDMVSTNLSLFVTSTGSIYGGETDGTNAASYNGVYGAGYFFKIDNAGQIYGSNESIDLEVGGYVTNEKSGSITGGGINLGYGYITNYGTISASAPYFTAVQFHAGIDSEEESHVSNFGTINGSISFSSAARSGEDIFDGVGGTVNGSITGGPGDDTFDLSHQIVTGTIDGGGGVDKISFDSAHGGMTVDLLDGVASGAGEAFTFSGMSNVLGSHYADAITGDGNANVIAAGMGDDVVSGGGGNDTIDGGAGNDLLDGGAGTADTVDYESAAVGVTVTLLSQGHAQNTIGAGIDTLTGFENIIGSQYADVLTGDGGNNTISGAGGADIIDGGGGNDILYGEYTGSTASYASATAGVTVNLADSGAQNTVGAGIDRLSGFSNLSGSPYADKLFGDANANVLSGGAGNDIIVGGGGQDTLTGGTGADRFIFNAASDSPGRSPDLITDFTTGADKIDLTALHLTNANTITINNFGAYTYIIIGGTDAGNGSEMQIDFNGANSVKLSDIITGIVSSTEPAHRVVADTTHYDLVDTLHAVAVDHGVYG